MPNEPIPKSFTVLGLKEMIRLEQLNFDTEYQRNFVWKKAQKQLFIDSLFLNYDIPKIYFHKKGGNVYDVIDGQQRLKTIYEFINNQITLPKESDPRDGHELKNKLYQELDPLMQQEFNNINLSVVILDESYETDTIKDMFLRYQNGEPLNAPEKRRSLQGNFVGVVKRLSENAVFEKVRFNNDRYAHEDAVAKVLHIRINGFSSISPSAIEKTYLSNQDITDNNPKANNIKKAFNSIKKGFDNSDNQNPELGKGEFLTLVEVFCHLDTVYTITGNNEKICNSFLNFELERIKNREIDDESLANAILTNYTEALRNDSPVSQQYRYDIILDYILLNNEELVTKSTQRAFTIEQKRVIYSRDEGICGICNKPVDADDDYHIDHISRFSDGGETKLSNGRLTHALCNQQRG